MSILLNSLSEGLFISFFSIMIVFSILGVIAFIINSFQYIYKKPIIVPETKKTYVKPFELSDIKDDNMLVAGLVASIDYYEETKENVRILSIKEI
ncbi:MAG: OadG family protein [Acholeplasmataceae bacterium]|nr:OadG family protein [Acholeplasmataceae bacterium]